MEQRVVHFQIDRGFVVGHEALEVLDPVYWSVDIGEGPKEYEASLARFTRAQRLAVAVFWYQAEVNNGGHAQFFLNPTGIVWKDALAGLEMFGLPAHVAILRTAATRLGGDPPLDRDARENLMDRPGVGFDDLDTRFYALERQRSVRAALTLWVQAHPDDFTFEGLVEKPWLPRGP